MIGTVALCEAAGWPFLAAPMQRWLGHALERRVTLSADVDRPGQASIHLLGGITIAAPYIEIGAPRWSAAPHMLAARDASLTLGYLDLWRAHRGAALRIRELRAKRLDGQLERLADGRASWQFGAGTPRADAAAPPQLPAFDRLQVDAGTLVLRDALLGVDVDAKYALVDGSQPASTGLRFDARGSYRRQPLAIEAHTDGVLPLVSDDASAPARPLRLQARVGGVSLTFTGTATDAMHLGGLAGRFSVQGPSLAALGDPLHVTLPTTAPFRASGLLAKRGPVWNTVIEQAQIGASHLAGAFTYDPRPRLPMLAGRLTGRRLLLADLGPAIGTPVAKASAPAARRAAVPHVAAGRVLPDRRFDLPALRAMDANVLIDIDDLDLGSSILQPLRPLRAHLVLDDGVLVLRELEARTGEGRLAGTVRLDGRQPARALWNADLHWSGVRLERWIRQARADDAPPYATGNLSGRAQVDGQGRSTAEILASLHGAMRVWLTDGTVSHLAVEAAGLDIAQGLGVLIKGDDALPIQCTVADFRVDQGVMRPRVLVLDTPDSTLWADGSLSLASETIDLRVVVAPKDFSPLALRTPLHLRGSFAHPEVSLDTGRLGARLGASALLGLLNPLAALIPLADVGDDADARRGVDACHALAQRARAAPVRVKR